MLRAGALAFALVTATALTAPAMAQNPPPAHRNLDANGVDLTHGDHVLAFTEAAIGSGGSALALVRLRGGREAHTSWDAITFQRTVSGSNATAVIGRGTHSERFTGTLASLVPDQANGATLVRADGEYHYRSADGTVISFGDPTGSYSGGETNFCADTDPVQASCVLVPLSITEPNGASVALEWTVHSIVSGMTFPQDHFHHYRLARVANSSGYAAAFDYVQDSLAPNANPPADWFAREEAALFNTAVSTSVPQAGVGYADISPGVVDVTDAAARTWRITGGVSITGLRRPGDSADSFAVGHSGGSLTSVTRDGVTTSYSRSVSGSTATMTVTDAASQATVIVSDLDVGRPTSITDPLNRRTSFQYDANGRLIRVTRPEGNYIEYRLDGRGNVIETRAAAKPGSGLADIVAAADYPGECETPVTCNRPLTTTDARNNTTTYTYDATHGGVLAATGPAVDGVSPQTRYSYTLADGEYRLTGVSACSSGTAPACVGTAAETRTRIGYDVHGQVVSVERGDGTGALAAATAATYTDMGDVATIDGPLAGTDDIVRFRYNGGRQPVGAISPDPDGAGGLGHRAQRIGYNAAGLRGTVETGTVDSQSDADWAAFASLEEVRQDYDSSHRPDVQRLVSGSTTYALAQTSYDALGRVQCTAQRMNPAEFATASLPSDACTLDTEGSYGPDRIVRNTYDAAGRATRVQTGYGVTGVAADEVAATYRDNGGVETMTDAEGNRTTYEYDGHDRLAKTIYPSPTTDYASSTTDYEQLGYDSGSNLVSRRLRDGQTIAFGYDALGRLTLTDMPNTATYPFEPDVNYSYDLLGRLLAATATDTNHATFTYDALGRVTSEANLHGTASMHYDAAGRRTRLTYPGSGLYVDYVYNAAGDMIQIRENGATSGLGLLAAYAYDDRGRRTSLTRGNGTVTTWAYDSVSRLTGLVQDPAGTSHDLTLGFTLNPASQIASNTRSNDAYAWTAHYAVDRAYTTDGLNRHTAAGPASFTYDANGNLAGDGTRTYTYNAANRLYRDGATGALLYYDPLGRLSNVIPADWSSYRISLYDGHQVIAEDGGWGTVLRRFVFGPGIDEPLVWYEGSGISDRRWLHADERGSIVAVSNDSGAVTAVNRYDEYGVPQGTLAAPFGYTGQQWIPELGMYYYRARIYSPTLGRFMQADPIGYGAGMNLYAYVLNDPVNLVDPSGLEWDCNEKGCVWREELVVFGALGRGGGSGVGGTVGAPTFSEYNGLITGSEVNCGSDVCEIINVSGQRLPRSTLAGLNQFQRFSARTIYRINPQIRRNIRSLLRRFGRGNYTDAQIDSILNDILRGPSTTIEGLGAFQDVDANSNLTRHQVGVINLYISELPNTPLNIEVRNSWNSWRQGE